MSSGPTQAAADTRTANSETSDDTGAGGPDGTRSTVAGGRRTKAARSTVLEGLRSREPTRYQMVDEHGRGGLGRVMRALDRELGRTVAIKELLRRGRAAEARFLREALITARLEHPSIVPVHEAGRWPDGTPFYSMKLVAGRQLRELIEESETLEQRLALLPHVVDVADAIAYAHARRIVHRDLKPANVLVGDYGETVVIDWGLAKDLSASEIEDAGEPYRAPVPPDDVTVAGTVMGTPAYMSPEQARGEPGDELSDVYALGAMLYSVLTGKVPYQGSRSADVVRAVVEGPPQAVPAIAPGAAADLVAIVGAAMHRDRDARLPSSRTFADELRRYLDGRRVRSHRYTAAERVLRWMRRHRELSAAVAVALAVLLGLGAVAVSRIVDERNTAELERRRAQTALAEARNQRDRLVLRNARVANEHDPTAALATLATYQGRDAAKAQELAATAVGRNAATFARAADAKLRNAATVSFSPPMILGIGPDRVARLWRTGATSPSTVAADVSPGDLTTPTLVPGAAFADGTNIVVLAPDGSRRVRTVLSAPVTALQYTDNGLWLMAAAADGDMRLLSDTDEQRVTIPAEARDMALATLSEHAETVVICNAARDLWTYRGGRWRRAGSCGLEVGRRLAVSADGRWVAVLAGDRVVVSDVEGEAATRSSSLPGRPTFVTFLADGNLAVGDRSGIVHLVDRTSLTTRLLLVGSGPVLHMAESPTHDLAVGFRDGAVRVASPRSGHVETFLGLRSEIIRLQWSTDGRQLMAADFEGFRVWPAARSRVRDSGSTASSMAAYSSNGRWLAADLQGGALLVADRRDPVAPPRVLGDRTVDITSMSFLGPRLITGAADGQVKAWTLPDGTSTSLLQSASEIVDTAVTSQGTVFALDKTGHLHAIPQNGAPRRVATLPGPAWGFDVSADGGTLLVHEDRGIRAIDTRTGVMHALPVHDAIGYGFAISSDGTSFVRGTIDGFIEIRSIDGTARHVGQYGGRCSRAAIARTGEVAVACGTVLVTLQTDGARWSASARALEVSPYSIAFSPDGRYLAFGSNEGVLYVDDRRTGDLGVRPIITGIVSSIQFAPDGDELSVTAHSPEIHTLRPADLELSPSDRLAAWISARGDIAIRTVDTP